MAAKNTKKAPTKRSKSASKRKAAKAQAPVGTITKIYKGATLTVEPTEDGFRFKGKTYRSLTALAIHVTGYKAVSGPRFFGLVGPKAKGGAA